MNKQELFEEDLLKLLRKHLKIKKDLPVISLTIDVKAEDYPRITVNGVIIEKWEVKTLEANVENDEKV